MIKVSFNKIEGLLNLNTEEVYFYQFKYKNIIEAIQNIESDIEKYKEETKIINKMLDKLFIESSDE